MDSNIYVQLIITVGAIISGILLTVRYAMMQGNKKEAFMLNFIKDMNDRQLEYYEVKNGHLERISKDFTKTIDRNTRAIDKLSRIVVKK